MNDPQDWGRLADIPKGQDLVISPPKFESMMHGGQYFTIERSGKATVTYTDNTTETAVLKDSEVFPINTFRLIDCIQTKARA